MLTAVVAVRLYRDAGVDVFAGGLLFEYACSRQDIDGLSAHLRAVGIPEAGCRGTTDTRHDRIDPAGRAAYTWP